MSGAVHALVWAEEAQRRSDTLDAGPPLRRPQRWALIFKQSHRRHFRFACAGGVSLYTQRPPSARNSVHHPIVELQRPSPEPALTCARLEPLDRDNGG